MKPKKAFTKQEHIDFWIQQYLQAKADGNTKLMSICKNIISKLGGNIPRL